MIPTVAALALIRNESTSLERVCLHFRCSDHYAAGLIDAVVGNHYFADGAIEMCEADAHIRQEYQAGFATGEALLDAERYADGWAECSAIAATEAAQAAEQLPVCDDDCPF